MSKASMDGRMDCTADVQASFTAIAAASSRSVKKFITLISASRYKMTVEAKG